MILLTRLNGPMFALNPDLIERADSTPDTVITLVDGTKYVVTESLPDFVDRVREYRASVVAEAHHLAQNPPPAPDDESDETSPGQRDQGNVVVPLHRWER